MPQIINSFRQTENPLAAALKSVGSTMFGDTLTPAINRQKLRDMQREEMGREEVARTFGSALDGAVNVNQAAEYGVLGGLKPEDLAMLTTFVAGNRTGPRSDLTTNAMAGQGKYKDSAQNLDLDRGNTFAMNEADNATSVGNNRYTVDNAFRMNEADNKTTIATNDADNAQKSWEFMAKPIDAMVGGQPGFVQQGQAAGMNPVGNYGAQPSSYVDRVVGVESGGNPMAKNPNSSATGLGQFTEGTWLEMMSRHMPEYMQGKSREQVLALRNDPTLSRTMTQYLGDENGQILQSAGLPVTDGTKYLAHFAGPGGAVKALQAAPGTPVAAIMSPEAIAANPFLQGMTTDQLVQWANGKVGGGGASPSIAPILPNASKPMDMLLREAVKAAEIAMPGATPEQQRAEALKLLRRGSKGISMTTAAGDTINIGGDEGMGEIPGITNANQTKMQASELNARKFDSALTMASTLITNNPTSVGAQGVARDYTQDVGIMAKNLADVLGVDAENVDASMAQIQQDAAKRGLSLSFDYDPSIGKIGSLMKILAYQGAAAIGGQTGNDLSDKDFENIQAILGDPRSLFTNSQKMLGKLDQVGEYVDMQRRINLQAMGLPLPPPRKRIGDTTPNGSTPAPAAPAAGSVTPGGTTSKGTGWKVVQ